LERGIAVVGATSRTAEDMEEKVKHRRHTKVRRFIQRFVIRFA
jgi:hypothetical protein